MQQGEGRGSAPLGAPAGGQAPGGGQGLPPPQFGQRSSQWTPSQPEPKPAEQETPWPIYQAQPGANPYQGSPRSGFQGASTGGPGQDPYRQRPSQPFPDVSQVPSGPPPSRVGPVLTIVGGVVAAVVIAPIIFVTFIFTSIGLGNLLDADVQTVNGAVLDVTEPGTLYLTPLDGSASACELISESGEVLVGYAERDAGGAFVVRGVEPGQYVVDCAGMMQGGSIMVMTGDVMADVVGGALTGMLWASLVGLIGLAAFITGIVWLVRRNRVRREMYRGY